MGKMKELSKEQNGWRQLARAETEVVFDRQAYLCEAMDQIRGGGEDQP